MERKAASEAGGVLPLAGARRLWADVPGPASDRTQDFLVRNILARWYEGKCCVRCGGPFGGAYWGASKPGLLRAEVVEQCDQIPGPQLLPILETAEPVVSNARWKIERTRTRSP